MTTVTGKTYHVKKEAVTSGTNYPCGPSRLAGGTGSDTLRGESILSCYQYGLGREHFQHLAGQFVAAKAGHEVNALHMRQLFELE